MRMGPPPAPVTSCGISLPKSTMNAAGFFLACCTSHLFPPRSRIAPITSVLISPVSRFGVPFLRPPVFALFANLFASTLEPAMVAVPRPSGVPLPPCFRTKRGRCGTWWSQSPCSSAASSSPPRSWVRRTRSSLPFLLRRSLTGRGSGNLRYLTGELLGKSPHLDRSWLRVRSADQHVAQPRLRHHLLGDVGRNADARGDLRVEERAEQR